MAPVPKNHEPESAGRNFGDECLRGVATAIAGIHFKTLLGSRGINTSPKDGLEELPRPFFIFSGFPRLVAMDDRTLLDPEHMRFRANLLGQR